ncbi:MAG: TVP38/TMEM64 family protein [Nitrospirae bacterium]|nr:TVP38/TMEM64 family protein [Nitrospirota bacterium]
MRQPNDMKAKNIFRGAFLVLLISLWIFLVIHYNLVSYMIHPKKAAAFLLSFHPYDDFIFVFIQILQVLSGGIIPGAITEFIGGYLYGPVIGTIYSITGMGIGSLLAFTLSRAYGLSLVKKMVKPLTLEKYDHFMEERGTIVTLLLFLIPGFPKSALCYIIGLSRMNIWTFIIISTAGRLFGTILSSVSGSWVRDEHIVEFLVLMGILMILFLLAYFYRKYLVGITKKNQFFE